MLNGTTFGFINGIITILSLITGLYATRVNKIGIIGAILAMIISDPLCDAYAIYIAQRENNDNVKPNIAINAFLSQVSLQGLFLLIIMAAPTIKSGLYLSYFTGFIATLGYSYYKDISMDDTIKNFIGIIILIGVTFIIDNFVYKYFKRK